MPGPNRRSKRLKQATSLADIGEFGSVNPVEGDLLIFDFSDGQYKNGRVLTGNYSIGGTLTAADLLVTNDITINNALAVGGDTTVTGALAVTGATALNGLATIGGTLGVTGVVTLSDALSIAGALTGSGFTFTGSGQIDTDLTVTGTITAGILSIANLSTGDIAVSGTLSVGGVAAFGGDVTVNANLSADNLAAASLSTTGNASIGGLIQFGALGTLTHDGTDVTLANTILSGTQIFTGLQADDTTTATLATMDPDGIVELYHANVATAKTATALTGGFFVNNTLTGAGYERVLTTGDIATPTVVNAGTVEDSILHWNNSSNEWDEMPEVTMNWVAGVFTMKVLDDGAVLRTVMTADADGATTLNHDGGLIFSTHSAGAEVRPISGTNANIRGATDAGVVTGQIQWNNGTGGIILQNLLNSGLVTLEGRDSSAVLHVMAQGDPDGAFSMYFDGLVTARTVAGGLEIVDDVGDNPRIIFTQDDGTTLNFTIFAGDSSSIVLFRSEQIGDPIKFEGRNAADSAYNVLWEADPDGAMNMYFAGILEASTKSGGFLIDDELEIDGAFNHDGSTYGVYGTTPIIKQTGVAVTAAGVHAALVALGFIT